MNKKEKKEKVPPIFNYDYMPPRGGIYQASVVDEMKIYSNAVAKGIDTEEEISVKSFTTKNKKEETPVKSLSWEEKLKYLSSIKFPTRWIGTTQIVEDVYKFIIQDKEKYEMNEEEEIILNLYEVAKHYATIEVENSKNDVQVEEFEEIINKHIKILKSFKIENYA